MESFRLNNGDPKLRNKLRNIQSRWSIDERRQRAEEGRRRTREFVRLLNDQDFEPEIWAVGAPAWDDVRRIAG